MSKEEAIEAIKRLDGINHTNVWVSMPSGELNVVGAKDGRVLLFYISRLPGNDNIGWLRDESVFANEEWFFVIYPENGEHEYIPYRETVPIEWAIDLATYLIENDSIPVNLKWFRSGEIS
jgi:hypothetical protein